MKINVYLLIGLCFALGTLNSCNSKKQYRPDTQVVTALNSQYPEARKIEWEQKRGYEIAEFYINGNKTKAWYDSRGKWFMTEQHLKYNALPAAIRKTFEKSIYANWKKEDIDKIERTGMAAVYVIEVEKGGADTALYFTANGQLVKVVNEAQKNYDSNYWPLQSEINSRIKSRYPDATVIETSHKNGKIYVDIMDNAKPKEMIFDNNNWSSTSWQVDKADIPLTVMDALRNSKYKDYRVNTIYFYETPQNSFYQFTLEKENEKRNIDIDTAGNLTD